MIEESRSFLELWEPEDSDPNSEEKVFEEESYRT